MYDIVKISYSGPACGVIYRMLANRVGCAQFQTQNSKEPMKSHSIPQYPWQFISQDLFMFESHTYFITTDHYSDFIEVDEVKNTLASTIVTKTEAHFTRHGIPETILTHNGPQFIATEFKALCEKYQIKHITSSPYWPKGNGKREAAVKIVKRILKKSRSPSCLLQHPSGTTHHEPSPKKYGDYSYFPQDLLLPNDNTTPSVQETTATKRTKAKQHYDTRAKSSLPPLRISDFVYAKPSPNHSQALGFMEYQLSGLTLSRPPQG